MLQRDWLLLPLFFSSSSHSWFDSETSTAITRQFWLLVIGLIIIWAHLVEQLKIRGPLIMKVMKMKVIRMICMYDENDDDDNIMMT